MHKSHNKYKIIYCFAMNFKNKVVLVTGAGSGIGRTISLRFAKSSANLSLTDINADSLAETVKHCENSAAEAKLISNVVDLVNDSEIKDLIDSTKSVFGKIHVVVNCAGIFEARSITDPHILEIFDRVINTNLRTVVAITHFVTPALIESKGCIVNISSISAVLPSTLLPYNVEKAALGQFTKSVALELAPMGVRVNSILAGPVRTNMFLNAGLPQFISDAFFDASVKESPMKKELTSEHVAEWTLYLASEKSTCITGTDIVLDSGLTLKGIEDTFRPVRLLYDKIVIKNEQN